MKSFGGLALRLDRDDINTDEIIPAKYLTENSKIDLKPHLLEDLTIEGKQYREVVDQRSEIRVIISRKNFGCGSSREHAVWAFEVNGINLIIAQSFARIFRQNMFNCGILAIELPESSINELFSLGLPLTIEISFEDQSIIAKSGEDGKSSKTYPFKLNEFDRDLVIAGGWLAYARDHY